jgi:hypothetical protein
MHAQQLFSQLPASPYLMYHTQVLQSGAVPTTPGAQGGPTSTVQRRHLHNMPVPVQQLHTRRPQQETEEQLLEQLQHASIPDSGAASSTAPAWQLLSWARLAVAREAMQHNHTLLLAQVDTVYFKDTIRWEPAHMHGLHLLAMPPIGDQQSTLLPIMLLVLHAGACCVPLTAWMQTSS